MQPAFFRKELGKLVPCDDASATILSKIKHGAEVQVEIKRPRNIKHHRKFFAMMKIVLDNQEYYTNIDTLRAACMLATGHADPVKTKYGIVYIPKSIAFSKMTADEFDVFYDESVNWVINEVIPGLKKNDLNNEVEQKLLRFAE